MWQVPCGGPSFRQQDFNQWWLQCNRSAPRRARLQHRWELILSVSFLHIYQFSLLFSHCLLLPPFVLRYQHVEFGGVSRALLQTSCWTQHAESDRHREARAEWKRPSSLHRAGVRWVRLLRDLLQRHTEVHSGGSWRQVMGQSEKFKDYSFFFCLRTDGGWCCDLQVCLSQQFFLFVFLYTLFNCNFTTFSISLFYSFIFIDVPSVKTYSSRMQPTHCSWWPLCITNLICMFCT